MCPNVPRVSGNDMDTLESSFRQWVDTTIQCPFSIVSYFCEFWVLTIPLWAVFAVFTIIFFISGSPCLDCELLEGRYYI